MELWDADGGDLQLLPTEPARSGAAAVLLVILSSDGQVRNLSMGRLGNVVWDCAESPKAGSGVCRALIWPRVNAPRCGASLGAKTYTLDLGGWGVTTLNWGCRHGQNVQPLGFQPLSICSCHSSPQFPWWVESQEDGGVFGACSAMSLYGRAAPKLGSSLGAFPKLPGLPWRFPSSYSNRSCGSRMELPC